MDLKNVSVLIRKINRLYDIINDIGEINETEKDLLKAYILDLYEALFIAPEETENVDEEALRKKIRKQKKSEKKLKKQLEKNRAFLKEDPEVKDTGQAAVKNELSEEGTEEQKTDIENHNGSEQETDPELLKLFRSEGVSELSDKLSLKPVPDLTKAMGINEKIFTINELFGGNKDEFENMLNALNGLNTYEEAKEVLMHSVASKYEWKTANKYKKARSFIKLVQRRYN